MHCTTIVLKNVRRAASRYKFTTSRLSWYNTGTGHHKIRGCCLHRSNKRQRVSRVLSNWGQRASVWSVGKWCSAGKFWLRSKGILKSIVRQRNGWKYWSTLKPIMFETCELCPFNSKQQGNFNASISLERTGSSSFRESSNCVEQHPLTSEEADSAEALISHSCSDYEAFDVTASPLSPSRESRIRKLVWIQQDDIELMQWKFTWRADSQRDLLLHEIVQGFRHTTQISACGSVLSFWAFSVDCMTDQGPVGDIVLGEDDFHDFRYTCIYIADCNLIKEQLSQTGKWNPKWATVYSERILSQSVPSPKGTTFPCIFTRLYQGMACIGRKSSCKRGGWSKW